MKFKCSSFELLVLLLFICSTHAAVINLNRGDACAKVCSGKENIFKYEENKIYVYNFMSKHSVKNPNAKEETLQLELLGKAQVSKITACDYGLLLSDIKLKESLKEKDSINKEYSMMKTMLEKNTLRFGFDDGRITGVCQDNMDNEFAVNIKKAILSSLQVSLDSLDTPNYLTETDIAGDCITEYTTKPDTPNFVIISKKKSIAGCSRKSKYFSSFTGREYERPKESRNMALLDGSYSCEIKVKRSEGLKESICQESHIFKPFISENEGSNIMINQELRFDSIKDGKIEAKAPMTRSDLIMKHGDKGPMSMKMKLASPKTVLQELCRIVKTNPMSVTITESFINLIRSMGESSYDDIKSLDKFISEDPVCSANKIKVMNIFLDSLSNVKSDAAFQYLIEDAKIYKLSKLGLSVFENPSAAMISTLAKKIGDSSSYNSVSLIVSSMIKSFCENTPGCMLNPDVINSMNALTNNLGSNCDGKDKKIRSKILYTLRSLANAGSHPDYEKLLTVIKSCVLMKSNNDDVKVHSVQLFRQYPCKDNVDEFLWTVYDDVSFSSEVRIEAYLSLVRCPTKGVFAQIIQKLTNEQSQQLGSFVWSHISNLMETADRFKTDVRDMLQIFTKPMNELEKKFNLDFRSYSKNIEKTYQKGFSAAKFDTNVIFSSSPIPSSITVNTTIDVFGRSINLFEMGLRGKGISEKIFGVNSKAEAHSMPHPDVVKIHQKISKKTEKLSVSLYTRFMGREVYFSPDIISDLTMAIIKFSPTPSFERSLLLLDTTVSVTSISGFPIELQIESAASINFNMARNAMPTLSDIELSTKSNYGLQITGKLLVNAHCTKIGVQSKGIISKEMEFGGRLKLKTTTDAGKTLEISDYQFEMNKMPDNSKLFTISNELSLIHKLEKVQTIEQYESKLEKCTGEGTMKIMGLKACISYKEAPRFSSFLPNVKAEVMVEKFGGFKFLWKKESTLKPIRKLRSLLVSSSFQGGEEDSFRLRIDRDPKQKRQMYEILLWQKKSYLKFEINDKQVTGQLTSGTSEATLTGTIENKGIFTTEMNLDVKFNKNSGKLFFTQKFTKDGPEIELKLTKDGDNGFNLHSKTEVRLTSHRVYNFFERFRHSTNLKYSGENEMSFVVENSKGNKPTSEIKSKVEIFWKTKSKRNFYINQNYLWKSVKDEDKSELFGTVSGNKCEVSLEHEIEAKDKKFNIANNFQYFMSDSFMSVGNQPSVFMIKFKREDRETKQILFETSSRLGIDISNFQDGKFLWKNLLNYPAQKINRELNSMVTWKLNQLQMYDINADLSYSELFKLAFMHKFTTTQTGKTSAEVQIGGSAYKISSELNLPKKHLLTIVWPENSIEIDSEVDAKSLVPFNVIVVHNLKMNNKLIAKVTNSAKYDEKTRDLSMSSLGQTSKDTEIYKVDFMRTLNFDISLTKVFYDYASTMSVRITGLNVNHKLSIEQFADINIDGTIKIKNKAFASKVVLQQLTPESNKVRYGYELTVDKKDDSFAYTEVNGILYSPSKDDKVTLKWGKQAYNFILGVAINLENKLSSEMTYRTSVENQIAKNSILVMFNLKNSPEYNVYYKRNLVINWATANAVSIKWNGEFGKENTKDKLTLFSGLFTLNYKEWEKINIGFNMECSASSGTLANANYILNLNFESKDPGNYLASFKSAAKWQLSGSRTANYYDVQVDGSVDVPMKKMEFNLIVTKDSNLNKILTITAKCGSDGNVEVKAEYYKMFAKLLLALTMKDPFNWQSKLTLTTSSKLLNELNIVLKNDYSGGKNPISMSYEMTLNSDGQNFNLMIDKLQRKDFENKVELIEQIKWKSNIPYIESGSTNFGLLVFNKDFQCNVGLTYKDKKVVDLKVTTSDIRSNLDVTIISNINRSLKFLTNYNLKDSKLNFALQFYNDEKYFKVSKFEWMYKVMGKVVSISLDGLVETSIPNVKEMTLKGDTSWDTENVLGTYKSNSELKLNGVSLDLCSVDLAKGTIRMKSILGTYIEGFYFKSFELNSKHSFKSVRDFMLEYKIMVNEKMYSDFKLVYFRMMDKEEAKKIDSLGEGRFYLYLENNRENCNGKIVMFIDKEKTKGIVKMKIDAPKLNMNFDEVTMEFGNIKGSADVYTGAVKYKGFDYQFKYTVYSGPKRDFEMTTTTKDAKPREVKVSFDFMNDYKVLVSFDDYFVFDASLLNKGSGTRSGMIKFVNKGTEFINMKVNTIGKVPSDVQTVADLLKALYQMRTGVDLTLEMDGKLFNNNLKMKIERRRLTSQQFSGGTMGFLSVDVEIKGVTMKKYYMMVTLDKNADQYHYEEDVLIKENEDVIYKDTIKIVYKSMSSIFIKAYGQFKGFESQLLMVNNASSVEGSFSNKVAMEKTGFGFEVKKANYEMGLFYENNSGKATFKTNLGSIGRSLVAKDYTGIYAIGKSYYINGTGISDSTKYELRITRTKETTMEISSTLDSTKGKMTVSIRAYDDLKTKDTLGIEVKGTTTNMDTKYFVFKSEIKVNSDEIKLTSNLNVNKNNIADLIMQLIHQKLGQPIELKLDYKGGYKISGKAILDIQKVKFGHSIDVKDGKFKTDLWSSFSNCTLRSKFDCYFNHINNAREIRVGMTWNKKVNIAELTWNKRTEQGFIFSCKREGKETVTTLSTPLRTMNIKYKKISDEMKRSREIMFEVIRKADPNKPVTFSIKYDMTGSLASDYNMDLQLKTNLMKKGLKVLINREVSMNIGDVYKLNIKAYFDGEAKPFFTLEGYLRQLSEKSYEMKLHVTNYDNFVTLTSSISLTLEELSFEYKLLQNNKKPNEFIFQFIPFRKLLITNKNEFKILISSTVYQYGYRRDIVWKFGKKGPNVSAFATLIKSPLKYYAEVTGGEKKLVIHIRPVGNMILGEVFRKIDGIKHLDISLKMDIDSKNILTAKWFWNPKLVEIIKGFLRDIFKPDNLKTLMVDAYQNSENQFSTFTSNIKMDLAKTMNVQNGLDFVKGFANDVERIPSAFAQSYSDDDLYMKSSLESVYNYLVTMNVPDGITRSQNNVKEMVDMVSRVLYEWCVEAKLYTLVYDSINNNVNSITYADIKDVIEGTVGIGKMIVSIVKNNIDSVGNTLDNLSKRAKSVFSMVSKVNDNIDSAFKDSSLLKMLELIREIRGQLLEGLGQILETDFIKQRMVYYQDSINNSKEIFSVVNEMKKRLLKFLRSSYVVNNTMETIRLIKSLQYKEAFLNMLKPEEAKFEMDLDKATMDIRLYIPPVVRPILRIWKRASDWFPTQILTQMRGSGLSGKLLTLFYRYEYLVFNYGSLGSMKNLIPPFKRDAWVLSGNSILTYDGSSVRIGSGKCSYLLARDIKDGSFSLIMHIKSNSAEKEFELSYINKVTISFSGKITIDGKVIESLPHLISKNGKTMEIHRDFDVTKIKTSEGLVVKYFKRLDYLKVSLTGKLHGTVMGLLGSNDFDVINDWSTPDGRITHDAGILSKSWSIDKCQGKTKTGLYAIRVDQKQLLGCMNLFKPESMSYLSRCFSLINPEPYFKLCKTSLQYGEMTEKEYESFICNLSRNYVIRCKYQGMLIRLKKSCVKCNKVKLGGDVSELKMKKNPKFNYIFIIEQSKCLAPYTNLIKNLFEMMKLQKDNVYTLLSFNGRDIFKSPHFKSLNNEIITDSKGFETLLADLTSTTQVSDLPALNSSMEGGQAIYDVIKMPSKQGYVEKIIFASCSACQEHQKYLFSNLAGLLNGAGISITYLTTQNFTGLGTTADTVGLGNSLVYSFEQDSLKSRTWKRDLQPPNDVCSSLATLNHGFVWSLSAMSSKMRIRRVAETLHTELRKVSGNPRQKCSCGIGNYEDGRVECKTRGFF